MTDVIQARAHLMQQVGDHVRNGYRWWCAGTVPIAKAVAWAAKAETLYHVEEDRNRRARAKKAGRGSAYFLMYPLDRSIDNQRLGWLLLVADGIHAAHQSEKLRRAEGDPVTMFGYSLVREPRPAHDKPVWTWRMNRATYEAWRERVIDTVRRGSDFDIRQMLKTLSGAPGFSAIRAQVKALHRFIGYEYARKHGKRSKPQYTLPRIWKCPRMEVVRVSLPAYLRALAEKRKEAAAAARESIETGARIKAEIGDAAQPVRQRSLKLQVRAPDAGQPG
jgi:hypothetical protein